MTFFHMYVLAYMGIKGKETAEIKAKEAIDMLRTTTTKLPYINY